MSPSNFLILDEPTNHLDIKSKDVLKKALQQYEGTFIVVSHDREFLDGLTNRIWDIENYNLKIHHFGVKEFLKRKMELPNPASAKEVSLKSKSTKEKKEDQPAKLSYEEQKELKRRRNKYKNQVNRSEQAIVKLEARIKELDVIIANLDYSDEDASNKVLADYESQKKELDEQMEIWETGTEGLIELGD